MIANTRSPLLLAAIEIFDAFGFVRSNPAVLVMFAVNAPATLTLSLLFNDTFDGSSALMPFSVVR